MNIEVKDSLSFCVHGTPVKFICAKCHNEHRLTLLESKIKKIEDDFEYKKDNRKDLDNSLIAVQHDYKERISEVNKRLDEIEQDLIDICNPLVRRIEEIENGLIKKIPHKCPVCEGNGCGKEMYNVSMDGTEVGKKYQVCQSCEGKGIIWG